jgi:thiamine pyrophosphate-dependent acetolactate synthase large subunit-like protein
MLGSMGLAPSIALGMALVEPNRSVGVIDGDGNLLMGLSCLVDIGTAPISNFAHFCLNNMSYSSTGGQPSIAKCGSFAKLASEAGYDNSFLIKTTNELVQVCGDLNTSNGKVFCEVVIADLEYDVPKRVSHPPAKITDSIRGGED